MSVSVSLPVWTGLWGGPAAPVQRQPSLAVSPPPSPLTPPPIHFVRSQGLAVIPSMVTWTPAVVVTGLQVPFYCISLVINCRRFTLIPTIVITDLQVTLYYIRLVVSSQRFTLAPSDSFRWDPGYILLHQSGSQLSQIHLDTYNSDHWSPGDTLLYQSVCQLSQIHLGTCSSGHWSPGDTVLSAWLSAVADSPYTCNSEH